MNGKKKIIFTTIVGIKTVISILRLSIGSRKIDIGIVIMEKSKLKGVIR